MRAGFGYLVSPQPSRYDPTGDPERPRHWSLYLVGNFQFNQSDLTQAAVDQAIVGNPQNPSLLSATSATARFYTVTLDPTFRYRVAGRITVYILGGFGWLHRTIDFTGMPTQGSVIQTSSPEISSFGGNSGVYDVGGGVSVGPVEHTARITYFVEWRRIQGLGVNGGNTLWPLSFGIRW